MDEVALRALLNLSCVQKRFVPSVKKLVDVPQRSETCPEVMARLGSEEMFACVVVA
jgi:hypothetical protein